MPINPLKISGNFENVENETIEIERKTIRDWTKRTWIKPQKKWEKLTQHEYRFLKHKNLNFKDNIIITRLIPREKSAVGESIKVGKILKKEK